MSEEEYREFVLAAFDRALNSNDLSQELVSPSAGSLKAEAIKVCSKRFDPKDLKVLESFFNAEPDPDSYLRAIKHRNYQIFRPLSDFLNNREREPTFKNIQLLAWLIDFKPRPFSSKLIIPSPPEPVDSPISRGDVVQQEPVGSLPPLTGEKGEGPVPLQPEPAPEPVKQKGQKPGDPTGVLDKKIDKKWLIGATAFLILALIGWFFLSKKNCMYWDDDHYVATSCNIPRADMPLIALDEVRLRNFKRIKQIDTLTRNSVDKLWWVSIKGNIEIYTIGGKHPLYADRKLSKVTDYVINVIQNRNEAK